VRLYIGCKNEIQPFETQAVIKKIFMRIYEKEGFVNDDLSQNNPSADYVQRWEGK